MSEKKISDTHERLSLLLEADELLSKYNIQRVMIEALVRAVKDGGAYHQEHRREVMMRHRQEWPALWRAIDVIVDNAGFLDRDAPGDK